MNTMADGAAQRLVDEIDLIRAVLEGYPASIARSDALRAARAIRSALAGQPSPAGQGDARALIQRYDAAGAKFRESLMDDHYSDAQRVELRRELTAAQDELLTALAARQPVGQEPVGKVIERSNPDAVTDWLRRPYRVLTGYRKMLDMPVGTVFYAAPPAQGVDLA